MGGRRSFSALLERLYASAGYAGAEAMEPFLSGLRDGFKSHVACFHFHDLSHHTGSMDYSLGVPSEDMAKYSNRAQKNLWLERGGPILMRRGVADDRGLTTDAELLTSEFYNEQLLPLDIRHSLGFCVWVGSGDNQFATITLSRDQHRGHFDASELKLAARLLPHVRNVYRLQQQLSWSENVLLGFRAALDRLEVGVVLLDRYGRIVFLNESVRPHVGGVMRQHNRHLVAGWPSDRAALRILIDRACAGSIFPHSTIVLHDQRGRPALVVCGLPAHRVATLNWSEPSVAVVMLVRTFGAPRSANAETLRRVFDLTEAEAEIAVLVGQGLSAAAIAARLSKSMPTVRTQLRTVFLKTETRRQADLVRLMVNLELA